MKKPLYTNNIDSTLDTEVFYRRAKALTPGVWVFVCILAVFLAGLIIFGFQGNLKSYVYAMAEVYEGESVIYVPDTDVDRIMVGQEVEYEGLSNVDNIHSFDSTPVEIPDTPAMQNLISDFGNYSEAETVYPCTARTKLENGYYRAKIVVAEQSPISAFFNND